MAKAKVIGDRIRFMCPGCKSTHEITVRSDGSGWGFNRDVNSPTFTPSVLVRSGHYAPHAKQDGTCWCTYNAEQIAKGEKPAPFSCGVCHSFVRDGKIEFLSDCTHELAGQTVELPEVDE
jgi:hypothetical protein